MRWDPFDEIAALRRSLERVFDDYARPRRTRFEGAAGSFVWEPAVEMFETDSDVIVRAELPNIDPKAIDISVTHDSVTLRAESKSETAQQGRNYYRQELRYGTFMRTLPFGTEVKSGEAQATYKNGILEIKVPKSERVKPTSVPIQVG